MVSYIFLSKISYSKRTYRCKIATAVSFYSCETSTTAIVDGLQMEVFGTVLVIFCTIFCKQRFCKLLWVVHHKALLLWIKTTNYCWRKTWCNLLHGWLFQTVRGNSDCLFAAGWTWTFGTSGRRRTRWGSGIALPYALPLLQDMFVTESRFACLLVATYSSHQREEIF